MSDLSNKIIADLKVELAESKAAANRVTESMGSEIMRLQGELEQQRTRAEAAEQELREANRQREAKSKPWKSTFDGWRIRPTPDLASLIAAAREALEP